MLGNAVRPLVWFRFTSATLRATVISTDDQPIVRLELDSRPETLTLVRAALGGVAENLSLDPELLDDLKTAVSEACNNVVMHAYDGRFGPMTMSLFASPDALSVLIADDGAGILVPDVYEDVHGVGLPVIRALSRRAEFRSGPFGGTEVWMEFPANRDGKPLFELPQNVDPDDRWTDRLAGNAVVSVSPVALLGGVLGRLSRALAARARFSLDRFSDVYLVTDALAAHAAATATGRRIGFMISTEDRRLELTVGPLRRGASDQLGDADANRAVSSPITLLSDELDVTPDNGNELLRVVMVDSRRPLAGAPT